MPELTNKKSAETGVAARIMKAVIANAGKRLWIVCLSLLAPTVYANATKTPQVLKLSLSESVQRASKHSRKLQKTKHELQAAQAKTSSARSEFWPTLNLITSAGTYHDRRLIEGEIAPPVAPRDRNAYTAEVVLTQPLFTGFATSAALAVARAEEAIQEQQVLLSAYDTIEETVSQYLGVQLKVKEIEAEEEVAALRNKQYRDVSNRVAAGRATKLDLIKAELAIKQQLPVIAKLKAELAKLNLSFARALGLTVDQSFLLTNSLEDIYNLFSRSKLPALSDAYSQALKSSPELKMAERVYEKSRREAASTSSKHLPSVDLALNAGTNTHLKADIGSPDSVYYGGEIRLNVPLFSGLSSFSDSAGKREVLAASLEDLAIAREKLLETLNNIYKDIEVTKEQVVAEKSNVSLSLDSSEQADNLFKVGRATMLDVLDAYSQQLTAKKNYAKSMYDYAIAVQKLKEVIGKQDYGN